jgi:hypothetical protein
MRTKYLLIFSSLTILLQALVVSSATAGWFSNDNSGWSNEEKRNFCHFLNSQRADNQAARISNSMSPGYATEQQASEILTLWRQALQEASLVNDSVLDKTHPDLKDKYRNQYQKALQYQIAAFEQKNVSYSVTGSKMKSDFIDWFSSTKGKFRVPKGTVKACQ